MSFVLHLVGICRFEYLKVRNKMAAMGIVLASGSGRRRRLLKRTVERFAVRMGKNEKKEKNSGPLLALVEEEECQRADQDYRNNDPSD